MAKPENSKSPQPKPVPTPEPFASSLKPPKTMSAFGAPSFSTYVANTPTPSPTPIPSPTPWPPEGWGASAKYGWGQQK